MKRPRDLLGERVLTLQASPLEMSPPDALAAAQHLSQFAEHRAGRGPVVDLPTRDFRQEILEEIADGRNYACWLHEQRAEDGDEEACERAQRVLAHLLAAYAEAVQLPRSGSAG